MINAAGIPVMVYGLVQILSLGKKVPGGMVGRHWRMLTAFVALFTVSYMLTPPFGSLPAETIRLIVAFVFLFGAIYADSGRWATHCRRVARGRTRPLAKRAGADCSAAKRLCADSRPQRRSGGW